MLSFYVPFIKQWFGIAKKILLVVVVFGLVLALFSHFMQKDRIVRTHDPIKENRTEIYKNIKDIESSNTPQGKFSAIAYKSMMCGMVGEACTNNPNDGNKDFEKSTLGFVTKMLLLPISKPPASGVMWAMNGLQNAGFIPKTFASEGLGFGAIQPFSKIWVAMRDLAYVVLVLIIIAAGFMIMFRMKLNPQTVISLENALPKIVVTLIIITFSFAIAGFLIDLMYLSIAIIIAVLQPASATATNPAGYNLVQYQQKYLQAGPWEIYQGTMKNNLSGFMTIFFDLPNTLLNLIPEVGITLKIISSFIGAFWIWPWLVENGGNVIIHTLRDLVAFTGTGSVVFASVAAKIDQIFNGLTELPQRIITLTIALPLTSLFLLPMFIGFLIFLTVIMIFFRIFFMLLTTYGKILLSITLAPIFLLFEAIPGQSAFSNWIKGLIAELITFPVVVAIFILGSIIVDQSATNNIIQLPFLVGIDTKSFSLILGMLLLFMTPDLVMAVKKFIVPKPGLLDSLTGGLGVGAFFAGATTGLSTGMGEVSKYGGFAYYFKPMRGILNTLGLKDIINVGDPHHPGGKQ
ncbi:MAG: hypothetical protein Q7R95_01560 [bacterium]|nr:hypothetical protein [bacterium]